MPSLSTVAVFALSVLVLLAIPGPNHIYIATRSAAQGRAAGVVSAFGVEAGTLVHLTAAMVGLSALIASSTTAFEAIRYLGAVYLVYLGVKAFLSRTTDDADGVGADAAPPASLGKIFRDGMLVNVLNPKAALFFLAFLPQFIDHGAGSVPLQTLVLGLVLIALGIASDLLWAFGAAAIARRVRSSERPRGAGRRARWATGGVYVSLGALAAATGGRH